MVFQIVQVRANLFVHEASNDVNDCLVFLGPLVHRYTPTEPPIDENGLILGGVVGRGGGTVQLINQRTEPGRLDVGDDHGT